MTAINAQKARIAAVAAECQKYKDSLLVADHVTLPIAKALLQATENSHTAPSFSYPQSPAEQLRYQEDGLEESGMCEQEGLMMHSYQEEAGVFEAGESLFYQEEDAAGHDQYATVYMQQEQQPLYHQRHPMYQSQQHYGGQYQAWHQPPLRGTWDDRDVTPAYPVHHLRRQ